MIRTLTRVVTRRASSSLFGMKRLFLCLKKERVSVLLTIQEVRKTPFWEAVLLSILVVGTIGGSIYFFEVAPHIPILLSTFFLILYGLFRGIDYKTMEHGMVQGASSGMGAVFLFFFIGILVSSWIIGGTIPTLMYLGFSFISPTFFLATVFVVTGIIGISVGSSLTTVATVGVAFLGMATALDVSLPMVAGAIVSGAFFGDKMSPLSDTTNLSASLVGVDLFEHIKNMSWTTVPAFIITGGLFMWLSPKADAIPMENMQSFKEGLLATGMVHWYALIPLLVLIVLTFRKTSAVLTLAISSVVAIALSYLHMNLSASDVMNIMFGGFVSETGQEAIDALLTRGGLNSMMFTIGLVLLALSMGGLLFTLGIVQSLLRKVQHMLTKASSVVTASALTAIGVNVFIGEQYLSILLTGQSFKEHYAKVGLEAKNLSRVMEDTGTVVNPLVPWSVCGIFIADALGVPVLAYLPFAFFSLLSPVLTILFGLTGKTLTKTAK